MSGWLSGGLPPGGFESYEKTRKTKITFMEASAATPQKSRTIPLGGGLGPEAPIIYGINQSYLFVYREGPRWDMF